MDPDVNKIAKKASLALGKAMELFIAHETKQASRVAKRCGRKTISKNDLQQQEKYHSVLISLVKSFYNFGIENKFNKIKLQTI